MKHGMGQIVDPRQIEENKGGDASRFQMEPTASQNNWTANVKSLGHLNTFPNVSACYRPIVAEHEDSIRFLPKHRRALPGEQHLGERGIERQSGL